MGQLFRPKKQSHIFPTCFVFSLPKGAFLRSRRNSADYISSMATFQGVGVSHLGRQEKGQSPGLRSQLGCLLVQAAPSLACSPQPGEGFTKPLPLLEMIPPHRAVAGTKEE